MDRGSVTLDPKSFMNLRLSGSEIPTVKDNDKKPVAVVTTTNKIQNSNKKTNPQIHLQPNLKLLILIHQ